MGCVRLFLGSNSKFSCVWKGKVEELGHDIIFSPFSLPNYNINWNLCFLVLLGAFLIPILLIWVPLTVRASIIFVKKKKKKIGLNRLFLEKLPLRNFLFSWIKFTMRALISKKNPTLILFSTIVAPH